jgi:spermidine synthase
MNSALASALANHPAENPQAMDVAHATLIASLIGAAKPERVLELGVGSAYLTRVLLAALADNGRGKLTSVDNFVDWKGRQPPHIAALAQENPAWDLVEKDETEFVHSAPTTQFDFIISDGDHVHGYQNAPDVFRIARVGATLAFHDTHNSLFNILGRLPERCRQLRFPSAHFYAKSRPDENTDRGLLIAWKDTDRPFTLDCGTQLYLRFRDRLPDSLKSWLRRRGGVAAGQ